MASKKDKRRKIARKAILEALAHELRSPFPFDGAVSSHLNDTEYHLMLREIRKAKVTVTWKAGA